MDGSRTVSTGPQGFLEWARVVAACGIAVLLLWTIGWRIAEPADPLMALTLMSGWGRVFAVWPTILVLTLVSAVVATVIIGRRIPQAGVLAAAVGLIALALCGGSMQALLAYEATNETEGRRALMFAMGLDCLLWTAVLAAAWVLVAAVRRWLWPEVEQTPIQAPIAPSKDRKAARSAPAEKRNAGLAALAICTVVAVLVVWLTISRTPVANIARGQVIASVCGALFLGALAGRYFTGISEPMWYVLAAPAAALISYLLGYLSADMGWAQGTIYQPYAFLATTPPHDLVRPLPVEYVAAGVAGALLGFWWAGHLIEDAGQQDTA